MLKPEIEAAQKAIRNLRGKGTPTDFAFANDAVHAAAPFIRAAALAEFREGMLEAGAIDAMRIRMAGPGHPESWYDTLKASLEAALDHLAAREEER